jgi:hypothetical protein
MIKCSKCGNNESFCEVHIGGYRKHKWTQDKNGRFVFDGSDYDEVEDTMFRCGKCNADISYEYRKFLQSLFSLYDERKYGI